MRSIDDPSGIVGGLRSEIDDILGIRDELGAALYPVSIITRTWAGSEIGEGDAADESVLVSPSPRIVEMSDDSRIVPGGSVELDDLMLKHVSKNVFPNKAQVDGTTESQNIEKFYEVAGFLYRVVKVSEKHLTWNIHIRKLSDQTRYA